MTGTVCEMLPSVLLYQKLYSKEKWGGTAGLSLEDIAPTDCSSEVVRDYSFPPETAIEMSDENSVDKPAASTFFDGVSFSFVRSSGLCLHVTFSWFTQSTQTTNPNSGDSGAS